ncbi:CACTA en-spm transposon protein [Cucumis melo var. makuwa]|uniref:CACTA en-spm transposon protein n=1 Tax=Cucumis melo var. makuwa TaxID=1194695 RepID=A0A5D3DG77_CUCMM|nr:CACTA en-spm transposon protein [Cucumis melo var. makuwa]TYK22701.1 CACTA en-spm transposon protein [Cucumis melo var. makuwa]
MGDNSVESNNDTSQPYATPTPRRQETCAVSILELYVVANGWILMTIVPSAEKPISPHDAMNRFVEHQMLSTFKEFRGDCHRHFKKYSDPEEARVIPPHLLVGCDENCHYLCDHYISCAFQEQSQRNKAARKKQPYHHNSGSNSFLRQHELAEQRGKPVDRVELFRQTHVRDGMFVSQVAKDAQLQSQPTIEGSQSISWDEICEMMLGRRPGYSKGLGWRPKPKARKTTNASCSTMSCSQSTVSFNYRLSLIKLYNGLKNRQ